MEFWRLVKRKGHDSVDDGKVEGMREKVEPAINPDVTLRATLLLYASLMLRLGRVSSEGKRVWKGG